MELVLQLYGVLLGLVDQLILVVPGRADFLVLEGQGSLEVHDLLLSLLELVADDPRLVLCRPGLIGGVHELPSELGSLSPGLVKLQIPVGDLLPETLEFGVEIDLQTGQLLLLCLGGPGGVFLHETLKFGLQQRDLVAELLLFGPQLLPKRGARVYLQVVVPTEHGHV